MQAQISLEEQLTHAIEHPVRNDGTSEVKRLLDAKATPTADHLN